MNADQLKQYRTALRVILNPSIHRGALCAVVERWVIQELHRVENAMEQLRPPRQRYTIQCLRYTRRERGLLRSVRFQDIIPTYTHTSPPR